MTVRKTIFGISVKMPCVDNVGSCKYHDVCSMVSEIKECPLLSAAGNNVACTCPFASGLYKVRNFKLEVPKEIPHGQYSIKAEFLDKDDESLACVLLSLNVSK
jgi:ganglioside GM2 activator